MSKTLILIRHAHRDTSQRELDNGLDDKGREQAKGIRRFFIDRFQTEDFRRGLWFVSSPKRRCLETLLPTARGLDRPIDAHPDLDEQSTRESTAAFAARIERFLQEWRQAKPDITVLCSHGDWLPRACELLLRHTPDFKKGSWLELECESDSSVLKWFVPTFRPFYR